MNKIKIFCQKQNYDKTLTNWDTRQGVPPLRDSTFWVFVVPVLDVLPRVLALSYAVRNKGEAFPLPGLPSPSSLARCHLSQGERPWQSAKFPGLTLRPAAAKRAVRRYTKTSRLCQGLPLWGSWTPLGGLRGQARFRRDFASV